MPLSLNGSGGITYPDGSVNTTRSVSSDGDTMTGKLTVPQLKVNNSSSTHDLLNLTQNNSSYNTDINFNHTSTPSDNTVISKRSTGELWIYQGSARSVNIHTSGAERFRIDSAGVARNLVGQIVSPILSKAVGGDNTTWINIYPFTYAYAKYYLSTHENSFEQFWEVSVGYQGGVYAIKTPDTGHPHSGDFAFRLSGGFLQCKNVTFTTSRSLYLYAVEGT